MKKKRNHPGKLELCFSVCYSFPKKVKDVRKWQRNIADASDAAMDEPSHDSTLVYAPRNRAGKQKARPGLTCCG